MEKERGKEMWKGAERQDGRTRRREDREDTKSRTKKHGSIPKREGMRLHCLPVTS